jgi:hypothetical protein
MAGGGAAAATVGAGGGGAATVFAILGAVGFTTSVTGLLGTGTVGAAADAFVASGFGFSDSGCFTGAAALGASDMLIETT